MRRSTVLTIVVAGVLVASASAYVVSLSIAAHEAGGASPPVVPVAQLPHIGQPISGATALGSSVATAVTCPEPTDECSSSYNWGGYIVTAAAGSVSEVSGSWKVPAVTGASGTSCPDTQKEWLANAVWVGIDGFNDGTVEQTGTESECFYGHVYYYAWYEFYPGAPKTATFTVSAGDAISASVSYTGVTLAGVLKFQTTLTDLTTGNTLTSPKTGVSGADRDSAEWISESPYYDGILGLTPVSSVKFTGASASIGGVTGSIGSWGTSVYWAVLVDYYFPDDPVLKYVKDLPSALNKAGNSFTFAWKGSGP